MYRKTTEASERFAERRKREDDAPRLATLAPNLATLRLEIRETSSGAGALTSHVRRIVVESAPALFVMPCGDPECNGRGHNITQAVMSALQNAQERFEGSIECHGDTKLASCNRTMHYVGIATYR